MSTENQIAAQQPEGILTQGMFEWHETGEYFRKYRNGTPQQVWLDDMRELFKMREGSKKLDARLRFIIGDGLAFGQVAFGEEFSQAIELASGVLGAVDEGTIDNIMTICRSVSAEVRRPDALTFAHHDAIASLEPDKQTELLTRAIAEGMSVSALRDAAARTKLTKGDLKLLKEQTEKEVEQLKAPEIKRLLKRAKNGEPPKRTLIVDLNSEESLQLAAGHVLTFFQAHIDEMEDWSSSRKEAWASMTELAKILAPLTGKTNPECDTDPIALNILADSLKAKEKELTAEQIEAVKPLYDLYRRELKRKAKAEKGGE